MIVDILKIILSIIFSFPIGLEREKREKTAGLRTAVFICLGATLAIIFNYHLIEYFKNMNSMVIRLDVMRIIAYYIVSIGFVGGNIILQNKNKLLGVTTSAMLLPISFMGFFIGLGLFELAFVIFVILYALLYFKKVVK